MASAKQERLEARVDPEVKELLARAAQLRGRSLTDFVVEAASRAAEETIRAHAVIALTLRDTQLLDATLADPPAPNARLREAFRLHDDALGG